MPERTSARSTRTSSKRTTTPKIRSHAGAAASASPDDRYERIQRRAYELWESEGRPSGRAHDHWFQAEREIASAQQVP